VKARNADRPGAVAAICQVDGARWLTVSGPIRVATDAEAIADAVARYAARYRQPRVNPERVALIIEVETVMGTSRFG
jgi:F420H(2)-dependent biliverdin reductase